MCSGFLADDGYGGGGHYDEPNYHHYNQHGETGLQLTGQHYSPQGQYTVGHYTIVLFFCADPLFFKCLNDGI